MLALYAASRASPSRNWSMRWKEILSSIPALIIRMSGGPVEARLVDGLAAGYIDGDVARLHFRGRRLAVEMPPQTEAPLSASSRAAAAPIPFAPPVTTASFPASMPTYCTGVGPQGRRWQRPGCDEDDAEFGGGFEDELAIDRESGRNRGDQLVGDDAAAASELGDTGVEVGRARRVRPQDLKDLTDGDQDLGRVLGNEADGFAVHHDAVPCSRTAGSMARYSRGEMPMSSSSSK